MPDTDKDKAPGTAVERANVEKPLNQTQMKNLERIVMGDFDELESRLKRELDKKHAERIRSINDRYGDDNTLREARLGCERLGNDLREQINAFMESLAEQNLKPKRYNAVISVTISPANLELVGHGEAINKAQTAYQRLQNIVRERMASYRRMATRKLLLQTVHPQSTSAILDDMPGYEEVVRQIMRALEEDGSADLDELRQGLDFIDDFELEDDIVIEADEEV
jgi:hypothetical protein